MSTLGILKLRETDTVSASSVFIIQQQNITKQVNFLGLQFSLDNATFAPVVSSHSTQIEYLSSTIDSLSGQLYYEANYLTTLINKQVNFAFNNLASCMYPISSIKHTSDFVNPSFYFPSTTWQLVGQANYFAGTGYGLDKNGNSQIVYPGSNIDVNYNIRYVCLSAFQEGITGTSTTGGGGTIKYKSGYGPNRYGGFYYNNPKNKGLPDPVWLIATPDPGYTFDGWVVTENGLQNNYVDTTVPNEISFYMPSVDVVVTAKFAGTVPANTYYVALSTIRSDASPGITSGGGYLSWKSGLRPQGYGPLPGEGFQENDAVIITATPYPGYTFDSWVVTENGLQNNYVDTTVKNEISFYMPPTQVLVTAKFVGSSTDTVGEYSTVMDNTQLPTHNHPFQIHLMCTNSKNSYQNGPQAQNLRIDGASRPPQQYTTDINVTSNTPHNNTMPMYGVYTWMRIS